MHYSANQHRNRIKQNLKVKIHRSKVIRADFPRVLHNWMRSVFAFPFINTAWKPSNKTFRQFDSRHTVLCPLCLNYYTCIVYFQWLKKNKAPTHYSYANENVSYAVTRNVFTWKKKNMYREKRNIFSSHLINLFFHF